VAPAGHSGIRLALEVTARRSRDAGWIPATSRNPGAQTREDARRALRSAQARSGELPSPSETSLV